MWLLLALLTTSVYATSDCPAQCQCSGDTCVQVVEENGGVVVECRLVEQVVASYSEGDEFNLAPAGFNCSDLQQQPPSAARRIELNHCILPQSLSCVAARLGAVRPNAFYIKYAPRVQLTADSVRGLEGLKKLGIFGEEDDNTTTNIPTEALALLPSLESFTMNHIHLALRPGDFALPGVRYLELSSAGITNLPDGVFGNMSSLETLSLWHNKLEDFGSGLAGLTSLRQLAASRNRLSSLTSLLTSPPPLRVLSIFANNFTLLPPMASLSSLENLTLFDNRAPLRLSPRALAGMPQLLEVDLSRCGLTSLPGDLLQGTTRLASLKLDGNMLEELPEGVFGDLKELEHLNLSHNRLQQVSPTLLSSLIKLTKLDLSFNALLTLPEGMFSYQYSLRWLSVRNNSLRELPVKALVAATGLEQVDLSYNEIEDEEKSPGYQLLESEWFKLKNLLRMNLSHNRLRAPPAGLNRAAIYLEQLDLSYNRIEEIFAGDAYYVSESATIDARHNAITRVFALNMLSMMTPKPALAHKRSSMLLDENPFHCDCFLYAFAQRLHGYDSPDTTEVKFELGSARCASPRELRGRLITNVSLADFACTLDYTECLPHCGCVLRPHTSALELTCPQQPRSNPNLTHFGAAALDLTLTQPPQTLNFDSVRNLNLAGLNMDELPKEKIPSSIQTLDLSKNNFTRIPRGFLEENVTLRLSGNPFVCDCWHSDDIAALQEHRWKIADYSQVNCTGNIPVNSVNVNQLCSTWRAATVGGVLASLGLIIAIIAILLLRYSEELKVWLYARGWFARWLAIDDDDRKYDAFVSFCHKDEQFVTEKLVPGLEGPPHDYKLCVHYRDWIPGEWIPAQIAQSVNDSRRTVIVVSQNFLDSIWGRAEFRAANMSAIKERKTRVIVILLEDITSHKELDPELTLYLSTNTYLKWGDPWFWDKLRYALPHKKVAPVSKAKEKLKQTRIAKTVACTGLDTRLTTDGVIINAAALAVPEKKMEHINLDVTNFKKPSDPEKKMEQINLDVANLTKMTNFDCANLKNFE